VKRQGPFGFLYFAYDGPRPAVSISYACVGIFQLKWRAWLRRGLEDRDDFIPFAPGVYGAPGSRPNDRRVQVHSPRDRDGGQVGLLG